MREEKALSPERVPTIYSSTFLLMERSDGLDLSNYSNMYVGISAFLFLRYQS